MDKYIPFFGNYYFMAKTTFPPVVHMSLLLKKMNDTLFYYKIAPKLTKLISVYSSLTTSS